MGIFYLYCKILNIIFDLYFCILRYDRKNGIIKKSAKIGISSFERQKEYHYDRLQIKKIQHYT
jgi:hypothetical protein